jgi:hypothetical protein
LDACADEFFLQPPPTLRVIFSIMQLFSFISRHLVICTVWIGASAGLLFAQGPDADIRGPKDLIQIPTAQSPPVLLWVCGLGGLALVALVAFLWTRRSRKQALRSPSQMALAALSELERNPNPIAAEAFASQAALTVRQYLAARFQLAAPRRTTEEFLHDLALASDSPVAAESDHLKVFLKSCDLAKFAASDLNSTEREALIESARRFIDATSKPVTP